MNVSESIKLIKQMPKKEKKRFFKFLNEHLTEQGIGFFFFVKYEDGEVYVTAPDVLLHLGFSTDEVLDFMSQIIENDKKGFNTIVDMQTKKLVIMDGVKHNDLC